MREVFLLVLLISFISYIVYSYVCPLQSHPISEICPIDVNLNMRGFNITNVGEINVSGRVIASLLCLGNDCKSSWSSMAENDPFWSLNISRIQINYLIKRGLDGITQSIIYEIDGKIGIGTTNPQKTLDVVGDINVTQAVYSAFGYYVGVMQIIDLNRNLVNIGDLEMSGILKVGGSIVMDSSKNIFNINWLNATNINATQSIRASQICIGNDCRTSWSTITENDPFWSGNITQISPNYLVKRVVNGLGQSIIYEIDGKIGIGTNNPTRRLHIIGDITISNDTIPRSDIYWDPQNERLVIRVN